MQKYYYLFFLFVFTISAFSGEDVVRLPYKNNFKHISGWSLDAGARFDTSVSVTPGSGSVCLKKSGNSWVMSDRITSDFKIPVQAGRSYTLVFKSRTDLFPPPVLEVYGALYTESGFLGNSLGTMCANSKKGIWEDNYVIIRIPDNPAIKYFKIKILMLPKRGISAPVWIDDIAFYEGVSLPSEISPKKDFAGSVVRVDVLGNIDIRKDGVFVPFFPIGIYTDEKRSDWSRYRRMGFNLNMWASNAAAIQKSKDAGLYSMMQLVQYVIPVSNNWIPQNPRQKRIYLRKRLDEIKSRGLWENLLFYYVDNEFYHLKPEFTEIIDIVRQKDHHAHPIYMLSGAYGLARMYNRYVDMTGTYVAKDGYADSTVGHFEVLRVQPGQLQPVVFAQINRGVGENFRAIVYASLAKGARGIGFWRDGGSAGPIDNRPVARQLPKIAKEIEKLMPLIRTSCQTQWHVRADNDEIVYGTRTLDGAGYLIIANPTAGTQKVHFSLQGLSYVPKSVEDYFSHTKVASVKNGAFTLEIKAHDGIVVKLAQ